MAIRSKVTLLGVLCVIYLSFYAIPRLSSEPEYADDLEPSWRWQHHSRPLISPPYLPPPPPANDASDPLESSIIETLPLADMARPPPQQQQLQEPPPAAAVPDTNDDMLSTPQIYDPDEKFITFFTHSGFQNQLIQVENGIMLAWYLNRTLILPRALLGEAFGWSYFGKLHLEHMLHDPVKDENMPAADMCEFLADDLAFWDLECPDPTRYAVMPFDEIFDLSWAKEHVRIVLRERSDFEWLDDKYSIKRAGMPNLDNGSYVDGDILFFKGATRYDWRIFDTPRKSHRLGKYAESLDIYELRQRKERLIHFSSLFGTGKLPIRRPDHYEFLRSLQRSITYRHPVVLSVAEKIVNVLGGAGNFIGLHVRCGDGWFVDALPENIESTVAQVNKALQSRDQQRDMGRTARQERISLTECLEKAKSGEETILYLATDARSPRAHEAFDPIFANFPCTFTFDDFVQPGNALWMELDSIIDSHSGASLRRFMVPLVDASAASRGWLFIGSKGSTFSGYIYRLHDVFWSNVKKQQQQQQQQQQQNQQLGFRPADER